MSTQTKPIFSDILNLIETLPQYHENSISETEPLAFFTQWLNTYSRVIDLSKGFHVNRCALYWSGYDLSDNFDGQSFVDSCQDSKGSLRQIAQILDTDLQIFELSPFDITRPNSDELALACSYGMMAIEEGTQLFCATSFGKGVDAAADKAIKSINNFKDLESFMLDNCGLDHAAMLGAAIACALKGIPMIIEGNSGTLVKKLIELSSHKKFETIIDTNVLKFPHCNTLPAHKMISSAILLKTLYAMLPKSDCGKINI